MTTTKATETKCTRCGRTLRSATSIADGMGRTCKAKVKAAANVIDLTAFRDAKGASNKAAELIEQAGIVHASRPHLFLAASSDGTDTYLIDTAEGSCSSLGNAYNYDNSDIMTDYFDRRYYLNVEAFDPDDTSYAGHSI